jgi:AraC-like DNA-binding protein/mannose-6-phosphate isomerase-like protein (cupin superfamily)
MSFFYTSSGQEASCATAFAVTGPNHEVLSSGNVFKHISFCQRVKKAKTACSARVAEPGVVVFESHDGPEPSSRQEDGCARFFLLVSGHLKLEVGSRQQMLGPDTVYHVPAGSAFHQSMTAKENSLTYVIRYRPELLPKELESNLTKPGMVTIDLGATVVNQARVVRALFQEMLFEQEARQEGWESILRSRLLDLAVRVLRLSSRRNPKELRTLEAGGDSADRVARYALHLKSRLVQQENIASAALSVGLGRRQFAEVFRKVTGQSWRRYVLGLRLKHAADLLTQTEKSASAVAFESGFDDLSNFHHSFKAAYGCSPLAYRDARRVRLPFQPPGSQSETEPNHTAGFRFRGIKGWFWTAEQYLEEIPVLADLKMNFLMDCYGSLIGSEPGGSLCNEWWKPMRPEQKSAYARIISECLKHKVNFCFALSPQVAAPRLLDPDNAADVAAFSQHYVWAHEQGVRWFSICFDVSGWSSGGPAASGTAHAVLVNAVLNRLRRMGGEIQFLFCPVACWGDGTNPEHRKYLDALGREMDPEVYVFWYGDSVVTPRVTRVMAEGFKSVVRHRLFLWDNYPVNDGHSTLHLGPLRGRDPDLCQVLDGYISNPMATQNQANRIPLATCADYASNPEGYSPSRAIGQSIVRFTKNPAGQQVLKDLVEIYPGFIIAGGGTGTNPVRSRFTGFLDGRQAAAANELLRRMKHVSERLEEAFPSELPATRRTVLEDVLWMQRQVDDRLG